MSFTLNFVRSPKFPYLCVFLVGVVLRGIPELLVSWYPIGYETITSYAPVMMKFYERSLVDVFVGMFWAGPLFYVLMWLASAVSGAHAFVILKVVGPLFYGGLVVSFLLFLKYGLKLDEKMAFVAALILVFQPVALRISWDRFTSVLGLAFLFAALTALKSDHRYKWWLVAVFAMLTALSREYIALVLFVGAVGFVILEKKDRVLSLIALAPAFAVFVAMVYPASLWWSYLPSDGGYVLGSYFDLLEGVLLLFAFCYVPLLPFVLKGFGRDRLLDPMVGFLLFGSFSLIISPWLAVPGYQRWQMLLVFPFIIYAVKGFERFHLFSKHGFKRLVAVLLAFMLVGVGYSTGTFSYMLNDKVNSYVPVNLVQSSVGINEIDDVIGCLQWLNVRAESNSSILAEERFLGWTLIYFGRANKDVKVIAYGANSTPTPALEKALGDGFRQVYLIWYSDLDLENFRMIYSQNSVSVFEYESMGLLKKNVPAEGNLSHGAGFNG